MSELHQTPCSGCRKGAPSVTAEEISALMPQLHADWQLIEVGGVPRLQRAFVTRDFVQAIELAQKVGQAAEEAGHHPALLVEWGRLTIGWWTHAILNLHRNDFVMAAKTDRILAEVDTAPTSVPEN